MYYLVMFFVILLEILVVAIGLTGEGGNHVKETILVIDLSFRRGVQSCGRDLKGHN